MPTDSANILPLLDTINAAARQFTETGGFADHATRQRLIRAAESLAIAAREPEENLYFTATQVWLSVPPENKPRRMVLTKYNRPPKMPPSAAQSAWEPLTPSPPMAGPSVPKN